MSCTAPDGIRIGKTGIAVCSLQVDVKLQVIVQQSWGQREATCITRHVICFQDTILVAVTERQTVWQIVRQFARNAKVVVRSKSCSENLVVPISIHIIVQK